MRRLMALSAGLLAAGTSNAATPPRVTETTTEIYGAAEQGDLYLIRGFDGNFLFSMPLAEVKSREVANKILTIGMVSGRRITFSFDWLAASEDSQGRIVAPLCALRFEELAVTLTPACPRVTGKLKPGMMALSRSNAQFLLGDVEGARASLDQALASTDLSPAWRRSTLSMRADALDGLAWNSPPGSPERDRYLVAALADYRALGRDSPDAANFKNMADTFSDLGAYAEARANFAASRTTAAGDTEVIDFAATVGTASVARLEGKPQDALDLLNALYARRPDMAGMKFYYHRGRTLMMLGRTDEAIADLTEGLKNQPDYPFALVLRGCAHASVGQMALAADDYRASLVKLDADSPLTSMRHDRAAISAMIVTAGAAARSGERKPIPAMCDALYGAMDKGRPRSPLLAPATP